ncbi:glutaredoxin family protein [Porticoccaceae bacterium]|jgi:predicted DCC family thiol-disulfide oxidoreductase YuxK|nr:glutaredoxin family protein [Porticoccaceae bacterium]MDA9569935.1 glutaredoxin family protein [Porticoccaceae bacterium]MDG2035278.1 glutaredoxin family protein [Pseudomonadales bacterium]
MSDKITLMSGTNCHLCDQAKQMLKPLLEEKNIQLSVLNVKQDQALFEQYGLRIPVVILEDGSEKGWPFTAAQIARMLD